VTLFCINPIGWIRDDGSCTESPKYGEFVTAIGEEQEKDCVGYLLAEYPGEGYHKIEFIPIKESEQDADEMAEAEREAILI
jgi:hypothetical protein